MTEEHIEGRLHGIDSMETSKMTHETPAVNRNMGWGRSGVGGGVGVRRGRVFRACRSGDGGGGAWVWGSGIRTGCWEWEVATVLKHDPRTAFAATRPRGGAWGIEEGKLVRHVSEGEDVVLVFEG